MLIVRVSGVRRPAGSRFFPHGGMGLRLCQAEDAEVEMPVPLREES